MSGRSREASAPSRPLHPKGMAEHSRGWPSVNRPQALSWTATHGHGRIECAPGKGARSELSMGFRANPMMSPQAATRLRVRGGRLESRLSAERWKSRRPRATVGHEETE